MIPFLADGDLSVYDVYDSDRTYVLDEDYTHKTAIQSPINPPYKKALEKKQANKF